MTEFNEYYTKETHDLILELLYLKSGVRDPEDNRLEYSERERLIKKIEISLEVGEKFDYGTSTYNVGGLHVIVNVLDKSYMDNSFPGLVLKNMPDHPTLMVILHKHKGNIRLVVATNSGNCSDIAKSLGNTYNIKMNCKKKICQGGRKCTT